MAIFMILENLFVKQNQKMHSQNVAKYFELFEIFFLIQFPIDFPHPYIPQRNQQVDQVLISD